jgi:hypothetical protein
LVIDILLNIQRSINTHLSTTLCAMGLFDDRHVFHNWACLPCMKFQNRYAIVVKWGEVSSRWNTFNSHIQ